MNRKAFTLIEMLVVIAIIGILASLMFPAISSVRRRASQTTAINSLRQLGTANFIYAAENKGKFVPIHMPGSGGSGGKVWWYQNEEFRDHIGLSFPDFSGGAHYPGSFIPQQAKYARETAEQGYARIDRAFGFNETGLEALLNYQGVPLNQQGAFGINMGLLRNASRTIQMAESMSQTIHRTAAGMYKGEVAHSGTALKSVAYRHNDKAAVLFWDNHTEFLGKDILADTTTNRDLWVLE